MQRTLAAMLVLAMAASASAQTMTTRPVPVTPQTQVAPLSEVQTLRNENAALRRDLDDVTTALRNYARCQREIVARQASGATGLLPATSRCPGTEDANLQALYSAVPAR